MKSGDDKVQLNDVQMSLDGGVWDSPKRVEKTRDYIVADPASLGPFRDFNLVCEKPLSTAHKSPTSTRNKYVWVGMSGYTKLLFSFSWQLPIVFTWQPIKGFLLHTAGNFLLEVENVDDPVPSKGAKSRLGVKCRRSKGVTMGKPYLSDKDRGTFSRVVETELYFHFWVESACSRL